MLCKLASQEINPLKKGVYWVGWSLLRCNLFLNEPEIWLLLRFNFFYNNKL